MRRIVRAWGAIAASALAAVVQAASTTPALLDIAGGPLAQAITELALETGVEILFDARLLTGLEVAPLAGSMSPDVALRRLLDGTAIGVRSTPDGALVLYALAGDQSAADVGAIPEILVVGRRTQNADVRRTENSIQAYKVATREEIRRAQRDNIEAYSRARIPANAQTRLASQVSGQQPVARSAVDLRGLGPLSTLVLVDGRRMPSPVTGSVGFEQPDLNGVPVIAIERIETLTGTASGIYGPSAIGGVMNIVLRRDYRGADFHVTSGITSRGDAERLRVEGRVGFTPDGGRTDIMLLAAHHVSEPLRAGARDYDLRARKRRFANDPAAYLRERRTSNVVSVTTSAGAPLTLDPEFGGGSLGAAYSYLPVGFAGTRAEAIALLRENAGSLPLDLPDDLEGTRRYLATNSTVTSGLMNLRHRVSDSIEAFVDGLIYRNKGRLDVSGSPFERTAADAPTNPFTVPVYLLYPHPASGTAATETSETSRFTGGVVARLPFDWQALLDYSFGASRLHRNGEGRGFVELYRNAIALGRPLPRGLPAIDPLGNWADLISAEAAYLQDRSYAAFQRTDFSNGSLRLAGPLLPLPDGPLTLTLLAEHRREQVREATFNLLYGSDEVSLITPARRQVVGSAYAELRAPLIPSDARLPVLRGLEVQLAARYDRTLTKFPLQQVQQFRQDGSKTDQQYATTKRGALTYTAGLKLEPMPELMLRASIATGTLPPTIAQLRPLPTSGFIGRVTNPSQADPKRPGDPIGSGRFYTVLQGGSPAIKSEGARTLSLGAVLNPAGKHGPRLSIDYSRIVKRREVVFSPFTTAELVANEDAFPERVTRGPLTEPDRLGGFTVGPIIEIDEGAANTGSSTLDALDADLDWRMPLGTASELRLYGAATWQPRLKQRRRPDRPRVERVGYVDGPLAWRGHAGAEWTRGPLLIDLNLQFLDSYRVTYGDPLLSARNPQILRYQGREHVPSQTYVDLTVTRRLEFRMGALRAIDLVVGVQNLFDRRPPTITDPTDFPYSTYGDPRRRRFEFTILSEF